MRHSFPTRRSSDLTDTPCASPSRHKVSQPSILKPRRRRRRPAINQLLIPLHRFPRLIRGPRPRLRRLGKNCSLYTYADASSFVVFSFFVAGEAHLRGRVELNAPRRFLSTPCLRLNPRVVHSCNICTLFMRSSIVLICLPVIYMGYEFIHMPM